jgi:hypothetical protein
MVADAMVKRQTHNVDGEEADQRRAIRRQQIRQTSKKEVGRTKQGPKKTNLGVVVEDQSTLNYLTSTYLCFLVCAIGIVCYSALFRARCLAWVKPTFCDCGFGILASSRI